MARKAEIIMDVTLGDANEREDEIKFSFFFKFIQSQNSDMYSFQLSVVTFTTAVCSNFFLGNFTAHGCRCY